jgi:hypothetical protein
MKRINYFYIDESGHINNDTNIFIHGCIKTDSPESLTESIRKLEKDILDDFYFYEEIEKFKIQGFHAKDNHPDIRALYYKLLPFLNFRAYFLIIDKKSEYFKKLKSEKRESEIFELSLKKLIMDRIIGNKYDKNIFYFENIEIPKKSLQKILDDIFKSLDENFDCEYHIESKKMVNLSVIDYLNYILFKILKVGKDGKPERDLRMEKNFNLIAPKIGMVNILNKSVFLGRKKGADKLINLTNLKREFDIVGS